MSERRYTGFINYWGSIKEVHKLTADDLKDGRGYTGFINCGSSEGLRKLTADDLKDGRVIKWRSIKELRKLTADDLKDGSRIVMNDELDALRVKRRRRQLSSEGDPPKYALVIRQRVDYELLLGDFKGNDVI
jgi:hypothetical protein